jgi:translation initiation factor IF-2
MSKKIDVDRLQSTPAATRPRPPEGGAGTSDATRVAPNVLRRRAAEAAPPPAPVAAAPAARTIIRRPGVETSARPVAPAVAPPAVSAAPVTTIRRPVEPVRPAPAPEPEPEAAVVVAPVPSVVEEAPPVVEETRAPVAVEPEAAPPAAPVVTEAPGVEAPPVVEVATAERAVIVTRPADAPPLRAPAPPPGPRAAMGRPGGPILPGLSAAVVSLPAGYDPTDPTGARRRARETPSPAGASRWGPAAPRGGVPAGPAPGAEGDDRRGRKGRRPERSEHVMSKFPGERLRKNKKLAREQRPAGPKIRKRIQIDTETTVAVLAHEMGVKAAEVIKLLMSIGQPATVNQALDFETATLVAEEFGHDIVNVGFDESEHLIKSEAEDQSALPSRPPVVTVMGHVDHGKTTLLDMIRKARVAAGEAGGITQHIGAYQVKRGERPITFLDTPGHAAFSAMRARGARATDVVILVVAADDGIMPQTIEAINHAKAAKVPIVVAINKMDKPGAMVDRIKNEVMQHGLVPADYGGDTYMVPVSALKGTGVDDLLDHVLLVADAADLRANPDRHAQGVVLEARLETGRGAVATLLVQAGTLKQSDVLVIGNTWGRVRAMSDDRGGKIKEAGPSTPIEIIGLQDLPTAGDEFVVVESERDARALVEHRQEQSRAASFAQRRNLTVEDLFARGGAAGETAIQTLYIVLKADVSGSHEALRGALEGLEVAGSKVRILHSGIGPVTESDITLAAPNQAMVVAFGVKADAKARQAADQYGLEIKRYDVIYAVLDDVKARMEGLLEPVYEEQVVGEAEVRALFKIPRIGVIAGCMVIDGKVTRNAGARVLRDGKVVYEGKVTSLKRFKEDVREVEHGFECGIGVEGATEMVEGDRIQVFARVQVPRGA